MHVQFIIQQIKHANRIHFLNAGKFYSSQFLRGRLYSYTYETSSRINSIIETAS